MLNGAQHPPHPVLAFAKTSLSFRKERDVALRQGEVEASMLDVSLWLAMTLEELLEISNAASPT